MLYLQGQSRGDDSTADHEPSDLWTQKYVTVSDNHSTAPAPSGKPAKRSKSYPNFSSMPIRHAFSVTGIGQAWTMNTQDAPLFAEQPQGQTSGIGDDVSAIKKGRLTVAASRSQKVNY